MIDAVAHESHYARHLDPIFYGLPEELRGTYDSRPHKSDALLTLVASYRDLWACSGRRVALFEHGVGQSYSDRHPAYAGGNARGDVVLFCCPNRQAAERNERAYPRARSVVVGSPRVERLRRIEPELDGSIAVTFHWDAHVCPETRSAFLAFASAVAQLSKSHKIIGHGHPRAMPRLAAFYRDADIEVEQDFEDVCRRASLLIADNTSALYEFAALDRPVVVLNAPWYRRDVHHGLRFWEYADVGLQVDSPDELRGTLDHALADPLTIATRRREIVHELFPVQHATDRAIERVLETYIEQGGELHARRSHARRDDGRDDTDD